MVITSKDSLIGSRVYRTSATGKQESGIVTSANEAWIYVRFENQEKPTPCHARSLTDSLGQTLKNFSGAISKPFKPVK